MTGSFPSGTCTCTVPTHAFYDKPTNMLRIHHHPLLRLRLSTLFELGRKRQEGRDAQVIVLQLAAG